MKNRLDERERQVAAKACQWGLYAMYMVLLPSLVVKSFILQLPLEYFWTEAVALILSGIVQTAVSARGAVFDAFFRPTLKNYLLLSLIPAILVAGPSWFGLGSKYVQYQQPGSKFYLAAAVGVLFVSSYLLSLAVFWGFGSWVNHRKRRLEREFDEEEEENQTR